MASARSLYDVARQRSSESVTAFQMLQVYVNNHQTDWEALAYQGICIYKGWGTVTDSKEAFKQLSKAADNNNALAKYYTGIMLEKGHGTEIDIIKAIDCYNWAAHRGMAEDGRYKALDALQALANKEPSEATNYARDKLAYCYEIGYSCYQPNQQKAFELYAASAVAGSVEAKYQVARMFRDGVGVAQDRLQAARKFLEAAKAGSKQAVAALTNQTFPTSCLPEELTGLGLCYEHKYGVDQVDYQQAAHFYKRAAEKNCDEAMARLGELYCGPLVKDVNSALDWFLKSAKTNARHAEGSTFAISRIKALAEENKVVLAEENKVGSLAQHYLGLIHAFGYGVDKNEKQAFIHYKRAAELGSADAMSALAECYYQGFGCVRDPQKAMEWLHKCTKSADASAAIKTKAFNYLGQWSLPGNARFERGYCYYHGRGVTINYAEAVAHFNEADKKGDERATCALGVAYELGSGVAAKDSDKAAELYFKAAKANRTDEQGSPKAVVRLEGMATASSPNLLAVHHLAECYANGWGVKADPEKAARYYDLEMKTIFDRLKLNAYKAHEIPAKVKTLLELSSPMFTNVLKVLIQRREALLAQPEKEQNKDQLKSLNELIGKINDLLNVPGKILEMCKNQDFIRSLTADSEFVAKSLGEFLNRANESAAYAEQLRYCLGVLRDEIDGRSWKKKLIGLFPTDKMPDGASDTSDKLKNLDRLGLLDLLKAADEIFKIFLARQEDVWYRAPGSNEFYVTWYKTVLEKLSFDFEFSKIRLQLPSMSTSSALNSLLSSTIAPAPERQAVVQPITQPVTQPLVDLLLGGPLTDATPVVTPGVTTAAAKPPAPVAQPKRVATTTTPAASGEEAQSMFSAFFEKITDAMPGRPSHPPMVFAAKGVDLAAPAQSATSQSQPQAVQPQAVQQPQAVPPQPQQQAVQQPQAVPQQQAAQQPQAVPPQPQLQPSSFTQAPPAFSQPATMLLNMDPRLIQALIAGGHIQLPVTPVGEPDYYAANTPSLYPNPYATASPAFFPTAPSEVPGEPSATPAKVEVPATAVPQGPQCS